MKSRILSIRSFHMANEQRRKMFWQPGGRRNISETPHLRHEVIEDFVSFLFLHFSPRKGREFSDCWMKVVQCWVKVMGLLFPWLP
jgi:hypothetical protein